LMGPDFATIESRFGAAAELIKNHWPLPPRGLLHLLRPRQARRERLLEEAVADIDECLFEFLARQRKSDFAECGVLQIIALGSRAQGEEFDDRSLRDQLLTLFFAGHETSATSLSWIHYLLSENRDVRSRMQAEVRGVLGQSSTATSDELQRLNYTEQVVNESLRMYSPIHSISRVALEPDTIGGFAIPQGATVYVSLHAIHRLPSLWPNPNHFDPDRFSPAGLADQQRFAFIPFAAGQRNCIGATMAMSELKLVIAQIAQRFELDHDPAHRVVPYAGTTMRPKFGMRMFIRKRSE
jgi:cytochrome P450